MKIFGVSFKSQNVFLKKNLVELPQIYLSSQEQCTYKTMTRKNKDSKNGESSFIHHLLGDSTSLVKERVVSSFTYIKKIEERWQHPRQNNLWLEKSGIRLCSFEFLRLVGSWKLESWLLEARVGS